MRHEATRILVVDDEASIRLTMCDLLHRAGYEVLTADPEHVLERIAAAVEHQRAERRK